MGRAMFFQTGKRLGDLEHGFESRLIQCKCGLRYRPEEFDKHLLDAAKDKMRLGIERALIVPRGYGLATPMTPKRPRRLRGDTDARER